jgi:hypothetical protein
MTALISKRDYLLLATFAAFLLSSLFNLYLLTDRRRPPVREVNSSLLKEHEHKLSEIERILPVLVSTLEKLSEEQGEAAHKVRLRSDKVVLRATPSSKAPALGVYQRGAEFIMEARVGEWFKVLSPKGEEGFFHESLAEVL